MHVRVRGGTVQHGERSLCATCKYATVVKGLNVSVPIAMGNSFWNECGRA